jgi:hypothetical protein
MKWQETPPPEFGRSGEGRLGQNEAEHARSESLWGSVQRMHGNDMTLNRQIFGWSVSLVHSGGDGSVSSGWHSFGWLAGLLIQYR